MTEELRQNLVDPILVKAIENNVKLDLLLIKVDHIASQQEVNHLVSLALREHKTIERVDSMWSAFSQLRILVGVPAVLVAIAAVLTMTHNLWHWPI